MHFSLSDNLCLASRAIPVKIGPLPYVLCCDSQFDAFETMDYNKEQFILQS